MIQKTLGRLERVQTREVFEHEALGFTPWLAQEENLALLADTIGLSLVLEAQEQPIGSFRADLLCKEHQTGQWVLIENQLDQSDHSHLGQIITYASGVQAATIIWIAGLFTEEHRAALDWLNASTVEEVQFFGIEIEFWRIGQSEAAPKFHIVSAPNKWKRDISRAVSKVSYQEAITEYVRAYIQETGNDPTVRQIQQAVGCGERTVKSYRSAAIQKAHEEVPSHA